MKKLDFDRGFQRKLLRVMVQDPGTVAVLADDLRPECFDSKVDRFVARSILDAHTNGVVATQTVLINEARKATKAGKLQSKDASLVATFIGTLKKPVPDKSYIVSEVAKWIRHQKLVNAMLESVDLVDRQDDEKILANLRKVVDYDPSPSQTTGTRLFSSAGKRVEERKNFVKRGIPTGTAIDEYLRHGGLPPKQLGAILAPPGRGKTAKLVFLGSRAVLLKGVPVLYISCELDEDVIADRFDAAFSKIQLNKLAGSGDEVRAHNRKLLKQYGDSVVVKYFPTGTLTVNGIKSLLKRLEAEAFYPGLIIVDYLGLMSPLKTYKDDRYTELGQIARELRGLAGQLDIPIWTAVQANRGALEKDDIGLEDLAESMQIAHVVDLLIAMAQTQDEKAKKLMRMILAKNRNGYDGISIPFRVDTATVSFKSV